MMTDVFQALADPTRRELLDRLRDCRGMTLGQLCDGLNITRQAVAKHIGVLRAAELVVVRRDGRYMRHYLNPVPLVDIVHRWVGRFEDVRIEAMTDLRDRCGSPEIGNKEKRNG